MGLPVRISWPDYFTFLFRVSISSLAGGPDEAGAAASVAMPAVWRTVVRISDSRFAEFDAVIGFGDDLGFI